MAQNVVIDIDAKTQNFERALDELTAKVRSTAAQMDKAFATGATNAVSGTNKAVLDLGANLKNISVIAAGDILAQQFKNATDKIKSFGKQVYKQMEDMQNTEMKLQSIVATEMVKTGKATDYQSAMANAEKEKNELMAWFKEISLISPYQYKEVINSFMTNANLGGQNVETTKKITKAILELGSGLGMTEEMMKRFSTALAQTGATGRITQGDLNQFANAGFGRDKIYAIFDVLNDKFGTTINSHLDFNKAVAEGKIQVSDFYDALSEYASQNYGGSVEAMASTIGGLKSSWGDIKDNALNDMFLEASKTISKTLKPYIEWLMEMLTSGEISAFGQKINSWVQNAITPFQKFGAELENGNAMRAVKSLTGYLTGTTDSLGAVYVLLKRLGGEDFADEWIGKINKLKSVIDSVVANKDTIIGAIKGIGAALATALTINKITKFASALAKLNNPVTWLVGAGALLGVAWQNNLFNIQDHVEKLKNKFNELKDIFKEKGFSGVWDNIKESFEGNDFLTRIAVMFEELFNNNIKNNPVVQYIQSIVKAFQDSGLEGAITKVKTDIDGLIAKVLEYKDKIVKAYQEGGLSGVFQTIGEDVGNYLEGQFSAAFERVKTNIGTIATGLFGEEFGQKVKQGFTDVENYFNELETIFNTDGLAGVFEKITTDIQTLVDTHKGEWIKALESGAVNLTEILFGKDTAADLSSLFEELNKSFEEGGWEGLGQTIGKKIRDGIITWLAGEGNGELAEQISTLFDEGKNAEAFDGIGKLLSNRLLEGIKGISNALGDTDFSTQLQTAFDEGRLEGVGKMIGDSLWKGIKEKLTELLGAETVSTIETALSTIGDIFGTTFDETQTKTISDFNSSFEELKATFDSDTWTRFANTMKEIGSAIGIVAMALGNMGLGALDSIAEAAENQQINQLRETQTKLSLISDLWDIVAGTATGDDLRSEIGMEGLGIDLKALGENIVTTLEDAFVTAADFFIQLIFGFADSIAATPIGKVLGIGGETLESNKTKWNNTVTGMKKDISDKKEYGIEGVAYGKIIKDGFEDSVKKGFQGGFSDWIELYESKGGIVTKESLDYIRNQSGYEHGRQHGTDAGYEANDLYEQKVLQDFWDRFESYNSGHSKQVSYSEYADASRLSQQERKIIEAHRQSMYDAEYSRWATNPLSGYGVVDDTKMDEFVSKHSKELLVNPDAIRRQMFDYAYTGLYAPLEDASNQTSNALNEVANSSEKISHGLDIAQQNITDSSKEVLEAGKTVVAELADANSTTAGNMNEKFAQSIMGEFESWANNPENLNLSFEDFISHIPMNNAQAEVVETLRQQQYELTASHGISDADNPFTVTTKVLAPLEKASEDAAKAVTETTDTLLRINKDNVLPNPNDLFELNRSQVGLIDTSGLMTDAQTATTQTLGEAEDGLKTFATTIQEATSSVSATQFSESGKIIHGSSHNTQLSPVMTMNDRMTPEVMSSRNPEDFFLDNSKFGFTPDLDKNKEYDAIQSTIETFIENELPKLFSEMISDVSDEGNSDDFIKDMNFMMKTLDVYSSKDAEEYSDTMIDVLTSMPGVVGKYFEIAFKNNGIKESTLVQEWADSTIKAWQAANSPTQQKTEAASSQISDLWLEKVQQLFNNKDKLSDERFAERMQFALSNVGISEDIQKKWLEAFTMEGADSSFAKEYIDQQLKTLVEGYDSSSVESFLGSWDNFTWNVDEQNPMSFAKVWESMYQDMLSGHSYEIMSQTKGMTEEQYNAWMKDKGLDKQSYYDSQAESRNLMETLGPVLQSTMDKIGLNSDMFGHVTIDNFADAKEYMTAFDDFDALLAEVNAGMAGENEDIATRLENIFSTLADDNSADMLSSLIKELEDPEWAKFLMNATKEELESLKGAIEGNLKGTAAGVALIEKDGSTTTTGVRAGRLDNVNELYDNWKEAQANGNKYLETYYSDMLQGVVETTLDGMGGVFGNVDWYHVFEDKGRYDEWLNAYLTYGTSQAEGWTTEDRQAWNWGTHKKEWEKQEEERKKFKEGMPDLDYELEDEKKGLFGKGSILGMLFGDDFGAEDLSQLFSMGLEGLGDFLTEDTIGAIQELFSIEIDAEKASSWHKMSTALSTLGTAMTGLRTGFGEDLTVPKRIFKILKEASELELNQDNISAWKDFSSMLKDLGNSLKTITGMFGDSTANITGLDPNAMAVPASNKLGNDIYSLFESLKNISDLEVNMDNIQNWNDFGNAMSNIGSSISSFISSFGNDSETITKLFTALQTASNKELDSDQISNWRELGKVISSLGNAVSNLILGFGGDVKKFNKMKNALKNFADVELDVTKIENWDSMQKVIASLGNAVGLFQKNFGEDIDIVKQKFGVLKGVAETELNKANIQNWSDFADLLASLGASVGSMIQAFGTSETGGISTEFINLLTNLSNITIDKESADSWTTFGNAITTLSGAIATIQTALGDTDGSSLTNIFTTLQQLAEAKLDEQNIASWTTFGSAIVNLGGAISTIMEALDESDDSTLIGLFTTFQNMAMAQLDQKIIASWATFATAMSSIGTTIATIQTALGEGGEGGDSGAAIMGILQTLQQMAQAELDENSIASWLVFATAMETLGSTVATIQSVLSETDDGGTAITGIFTALQQLATAELNEEVIAQWMNFANALQIIGNVITQLNALMGEGSALSANSEDGGIGGIFGLLFGGLDVESILALLSMFSPELLTGLMEFLTTEFDSNIIDSWTALGNALQIMADAIATIMIVLTGGELGEDGEIGTLGDEAVGATLIDGLEEFAKAAQAQAPILDTILNPVLQKMANAMTTTVDKFMALAEFWIGSQWKEAMKSFQKSGNEAVALTQALADKAHEAEAAYLKWADAIWAVINALRVLASMGGDGGSKGGGSKGGGSKGGGSKGGGGKEYVPPTAVAGGTHNFRYGTAIVGEHGPELITNNTSQAWQVFSNNTLMDEIARTRHSLNLLSNSAEYVSYNRILGSSGGGTITNDNSQNINTTFGTIVGDDAFRAMVEDELTSVVRRELWLAR